MAEKFESVSQDEPEKTGDQNSSVRKIEEKPSSWSEKKESILNNLDRRVESAVELSKVINGVSLEDSHEQVVEKLQTFLDSQKSKFSAEAVEGADRCKKISEEVVLLFEKIKTYNTEESKEPDEKLIQLEERVNSLQEEMDSLLKHPDTEFLVKFEKIFDSLIDKNKYIKETMAAGGEKQFKKDFLDREDAISNKDIHNITVEPFDVIFRIKKDIGSVSGFYCPGTPFISASTSGGYLEEDRTIRHERIHNALSSIEVAKHHHMYMPRLQQNYAMYKDFKKMNAPEVIVNERIRALERFKYYDLINEHHEEILAAAQGGDFWERSSESETLGIIVGNRKFLAKQSAFDRAANTLSTAGKNIIDNDKELASIIKREDDPRVKEIIEKLRSSFRTGVANVVEQIKEAEVTANAIGPEAEEKLQILLLMLPPTKYRHIKSYFEYIYGTKS